MDDRKLEKIVSWAKRRGFVIAGSEIYGGVGGVYDFGPYGVALKNNIKKLWWKTFVDDREDVVGIESAILMNRAVWQASGHEKNFVDWMIECQNCHTRIRIDDLPIESQKKGNEIFWHSKGSVLCTVCGKDIDIKPVASVRQFNTMFKTYIGATQDEKNTTYLRPETAQGMFTDFKQVMEVSRKKIPFGIAQMGKSFRNEIMTKDFLFRVREFEIAEIEYFVKPGDDEKTFDEWLKNWQDFLVSIGLKKENLKNYEHPKEGLAHYSKRTVDIQYNYPFGWKELTGVANRTDFDLKSHEEASGKDLKYFDEETKEKYWPYVIEPTLGIERLMLAVICDAYEEFPNGRAVIASQQAKQSIDNDKIAASSPTPRKDNDSIETVLHFSPSLAPIKVAVLPLMKKLSEEARKVYQDIKTCYSDIEFDETGSIGKRYRRQDEIGTPYCVTFDFDSLDDKKVTVRDRDTMKQERITIADLKNYLFDKLNIY